MNHIIYTLAGIIIMILALGVITGIVLAIDWLDTQAFGLFDSLLWVVLVLLIAYFLGRSVVG